MHAEIDRLLERFNIDPSYTHNPHSVAARSRFRTLISNINGTDLLIPFVSYMIYTGVSRQDTDTTGDLNMVFSSHGYTVSVLDEAVVLRPELETPAQKIAEQQRSWLEANAPETTLRHLQHAREKLTQGEWADALGACRNALESLTTTGSFPGSLDELVREGVIVEGTDQRKKDAELLTATYGFCSTIGSHSGGQALANEGRARMGLMMTETGICFLVSQVKDARSRGICLHKWH